MKQWFRMATFACLVGSAGFVAAQTPAGAGRQGGTGAGTAGKGQEPTSTAKPAPGSPAQGTPAAADAMFIRTAATDGMAEVEHGRLAAQNATNDEVKQFGQRMVDDHSKAGDELKGLASQKNVTLPTELDAKHKAMQDKLAKMKGEAFDRAYMSHMVTAHQQAVSLFTRESSSGKDADAKTWAAKTLPTLQEHLKMAQDLQKEVAASAK